MREYLVDEFLGNSDTHSLTEQIDKKVSLLYDLCELHRRKNARDEREAAIRELLSSYTTERQMDNAIHDVVAGKCTINNLLKL